MTTATATIFLLLTLLGCTTLLGRARATLRELAGVEAQLASLRSTLAQAEHKALEKQEKQQVAEHFVKEGSNLVENIHRTVSGLTFGILEQIQGTAEPARLVRHIHDNTSEQVYTSIRDINRRLFTLLDPQRGARRNIDDGPG